MQTQFVLNVIVKLWDSLKVVFLLVQLINLKHFLSSFLSILSGDFLGRTTSFS